MISNETPLPLPQPWHLDAACRGLDPDLFHPRVNETHVARQAKDVCATCEVSDDCLRYALDLDITAGVWGGLSVEERQKLTVRTGLPPINHGSEGGARAHYRRGETPCPSCRLAANRARVERAAS